MHRSGNMTPDAPRDDDWQGLQEPAWAGDTDGSPDLDPTAGPKHLAPAAEPLPPAAGHSFQERHLVELLVRHGHQWYDEVGSTTIAAYLTGNVADLLQSFDAPAYRDMVAAVTEQVRSGKTPAPDWYMSQPDPALRKLAVDAAVSPYTYSPNWKEMYGLHLSQKLPEDNHRLAAETFLYIFRMEKIERKARENAAKIADLERDGKLDQLRTHLKVQMKLQQLRADLAKELGTVVLHS